MDYGWIMNGLWMDPHLLNLTNHPSHPHGAPASPFVRIMLAPSAMRRSASPRLRQPHTKGTWQGMVAAAAVKDGENDGENLGETLENHGN